MTDTGGNRLQMVRGILEAIIVATLLWTGTSLIALREQNAAMQVQLSTIQTQLIDVPSMKLKLAEHQIEINMLKENQKELKSVRNLR